MSDLQRRSMAEFQKRGYIVANVERRKSFPNKNKRRCSLCGQVPLLNIAVDMFNAIDFIAFRPLSIYEPIMNKGAIVFVQTTDRTSHSKRRNKILASAECKFAVLSGIQICIQSWRKVDNRWQCQDEFFSSDQFAKGLPLTVEEFYEKQRREKLPDLPPGSELFNTTIRDADLPF